MCGIAGILGYENASGESLARSMTDRIPHRGPDDADAWADDDAGIALGHRRLSILDLSPLGRQPMHSACGRFVTVYNGEVYNFAEIKRELEPLGHAFKGGSDTEVILAAVRQWGLRKAVTRFVGMFAIALWDRQERSLSLVRDRLGIKPLFYGRVNGAFAFASELKPLKALPGFDNHVNREALSLYFRHNYIPAPYSIYSNIWKLEPGTILTLRAGQSEPELEQYWSARDVWISGAAAPFPGDAKQAADELERLLQDAVSLRMVADVPLGAFLSGGIDSSTVVALMQSLSSRPVKTFCIGFHEKGYNEAEHAKAVAAHLGTDHTELYLTPREMLDVVPLIPHFWDEPFSDSSQIPTYCVSKLARQNVTVSLSGDGGDELFAGYQRYFWMNGWNTLSRVPLAVRKGMRSLLRRLPRGSFDLLGSVGPKIRWRLDMLGMADFSEFYRFFISHQKHPEDIVLGGAEPPTALTRPDNRLDTDLFRQMMFWDLVSYLPDDILTKVDRASMAVSLEARVPLLDHRVVEFASRLPTAMNVRGGQGKCVLRDVLYRYVPQNLVERPKVGFGVPIEHWLKNELRDWCESLIGERRLREEGYLDSKMVRRMWDEYLSGQANWHYYLWDVLMFQAWLEHNIAP
ncbi:asparagine synthase (glutamine-hydrolyzing) [Paucidesulfovibrio longus]|uniref:asparagine synthase (glutamine-hydrolyzing) n=1 Tax=Paucidesulfovibrio longus TaxID=889 RepID=UPI0003B62607|nr:asparagine synthase (glutamine-hydrolyzing) [Paucidesulfovibrio longus]